MSSIFPPFDPGDDEFRKRRRQAAFVPLRLILPNVVTLLALCAGLTSMRMAIEGRYDYAIAAIAIAAVLDGIDGRVARLLKSSSRFGAELDSLTDFLNFGVAPAMLVYVWALDEARSLGWIGALVFAICAALRLARFNVALDAPDKPEWQSNFFVGIPAPAGAMTSLLPIYMEFVGIPHGFWTAPVVLVYVLVIGLLMVSRVPTWSGKLIGKGIAREKVLPFFVVAVLIVALLLSFPWTMLTILTLAYLASLPLSWNAWERRLKADKVAAAAKDGESGPDPSGGSPAP